MKPVEINSLTKIYNRRNAKMQTLALDKVDLNVDAGCFFGLLGPNGAGKTTIIKILMSVSKLTSGTVRLFGDDVNNIKTKSRIGFLPENHKYPPYLSGYEVLNYFGKFTSFDNNSLKNRINELFDLVKLENWKKHKVKTYSKGMTQRLGLAQALINNPDLLFLDEPTDGIDPIGRKEIRDLLIELKRQGKTIFLNSHLLSEVEMVADRVAIMNKGKILREGSIAELTEDGNEYHVTIEGILPPNFEIDGFNFYNHTSNSFNVRLADSKDINKIIDELRSRNLMIKNIISQKESL